MTAPLKNLKKTNFSISETAAKVFPVLQQQRTQSFLIIALTLSALSLFGLFAISPTVTTIIQLRKQLADNKAVDQQLNEKIANLSILQTKYDSLQNDLPLALAAVPDTHKVSLLLGDLQAVAVKENVTLTRIQTDPIKISSVQNTSGSTVTFSLDAEGSKNDIEKFVTALVSFERIIVLDTITLSNSDNSQTAKAQVDIQGKAYFKSF